MTDDQNRRPAESAPVRNPTEARQGATPNRARWVLIIGLPAVIVLMFIAYLVSVP